ncbi:hypothetical protein BGZ65_010074, partial [Modicella reniformis]
MRRSARSKTRKNSIASSNEIIPNGDTSRLRIEPVENGEYPAVRLVDPGPMPLLSPSASLSVPVAAAATTTTTGSLKDDNSGNNNNNNDGTRIE